MFRPILCLAIASMGTPLLWSQGDTCASATPITTGSYAWDNSASTDSNEGCIGTADLFWSWTAPAAGDYLVELTWPAPNMEFDAALSVFGEPLCAFTHQIGCNVNYAARGGVRVPSVVAGDTYLIQVSGWFGMTGSGVLNVLPAPCTFPNYTDDGLEENDQPSMAVPLVAGTYTDLFVAHGDPDYYSIVIPPGHAVQVSFSGLSTPHEAYLHHANGALVGPGYTGMYYDPNVATALPMVLSLTHGAGIYERDRCGEYDLTISYTPSDPRFETFCNPPAPNSAGKATILDAWVNAPQYGSEVVLGSYNGPPGQFGYYLVGTQFTDPGTPVGFGQLCLSGTVARYNVAGTALQSLGQYSNSGTFNNLSNTGYFGYGFMPPSQLPAPLGTIQAGDTWFFQIWHREPNGGSHLSNGVRVQY